MGNQPQTQKVVAYDAQHPQYASCVVATCHFNALSRGSILVTSRAEQRVCFGVQNSHGFLLRSTISQLAKSSFVLVFCVLHRNR